MDRELCGTCHKLINKCVCGTTNYCPMCEQANKEIERLKEDLRRQDTSLLLANQNLEQDYTELEQKIEKAIAILDSKEPMPWWLRKRKVKEILEGK